LSTETHRTRNKNKQTNHAASCQCDLFRCFSNQHPKSETETPKRGRVQQRKRVQPRLHPRTNKTIITRRTKTNTHTHTHTHTRKKDVRPIVDASMQAMEAVWQEQLHVALTAQITTRELSVHHVLITPISAAPGNVQGGTIARTQRRVLTWDSHLTQLHSKR
jgi:hypothetical protein